MAKLEKLVTGNAEATDLQSGKRTRWVRRLAAAVSLIVLTFVESTSADATPEENTIFRFPRLDSKLKQHTGSGASNTLLDLGIVPRLVSYTKV
jgi:hypothetical protein